MHRRDIVLLILFAMVWGAGKLNLPDIPSSGCSALADGDDWADVDAQVCEAADGIDGPTRQLLADAYVEAGRLVDEPEPGAIDITQIQRRLTELIGDARHREDLADLFAEVSRLQTSADLPDRYAYGEFWREVAEGLAHD